MLMGTAYPPLTASLAPTSVGGSSSSSTVTSNASTATPVGGSGQRNYAWRRTGGSTSINPVSPSSASTTFQATGMAVGSISATFVCDITDAVTGQLVTTTNAVSVSLTRGYPPLSVSGPAAIFVQTPSSTPITVSGSTSVSVSGGTGSYSYSWSGSGDFTVSGGGSSASASRLLSPTGGVSGSISCTITDTGTGEQVTVSAGVVLINNGTPPSPPVVSISPNPAYGNSSAASVPAYVSASVSGGSGSYAYYWSNGGGAGGSSTAFYSGAMDYLETRYGSGSVIVVDTVTGLQGSASVSIEWFRYNFN